MKALIARDPSELASAHQAMLSWCEDKDRELSAERCTVEQELDIAQRSKWRTTYFKRKLRELQRRQVFYGKIREAVNAGYFIVPNFNMDSFAVRTDAKTTKGGVKSDDWSHPSWFPQPAKLLAPGEGRYISPHALLETWTEPRKDDQGRDRKRYLAVPTDFMLPDFPTDLAKPEIMSRTQEAMARKLFDEMGVARDQVGCGDPMILGRLLNPRRGAAITFFIAWVFDPSRL